MAMTLCVLQMLLNLLTLFTVVSSYDQQSQGLTEWPSDIPADASEIILNNNQIRSVPSADLNYLTQLSHLSLSVNELEIFPDVTPFAATLTSLYLTNNQITAVPTEHLEGLSQLQYLTLDNNKLTVFPDIEPMKSSLIWLTISGNDIAEVPTESFIGFTKLTTLALENNEITSVPNSCSLDFWERITSPTLLNSNHFTCDCHAQHLYSVNSALANYVRCMYPDDFSTVELKALSITDLSCLGDTTSGSKFREAFMTKVKSDYYCSHPPVVMRTTALSVPGCASICLNIPHCFYFNVFHLDNGKVLCDITDTSATQSSVEPIEDSNGWSYYSSL